MSDEQTIYIGPQDDLTNVRERLERIPTRRVTLVIPSQTLLRSLIAWRNLYARAQELGKEVLIISSDPQVRSVAQAAKFKVASLESGPPVNKPRSSGRILRPPLGERGQTTPSGEVRIPPRGPAEQRNGGSSHVRQSGPSPLREPRPAQQSPESRIVPTDEPSADALSDTQLPPAGPPEQRYGEPYDFHFDTSPPIRPLSREQIEEEPDLFLDDVQMSHNIRKAANEGSKEDFLAGSPQISSPIPVQVHSAEEPSQPYRVIPSEDEADPFADLGDHEPPLVGEQRGSVSIDDFDTTEQRIQDIPDFTTEKIQSGYGEEVYEGNHEPIIVEADPPGRTWMDVLAESEQEAGETASPSRAYGIRPRSSLSGNTPLQQRDEERPRSMPPIEDQPTQITPQASPAEPSPTPIRARASAPSPAPAGPLSSKNRGSPGGSPTGNQPAPSRSQSRQATQRTGGARSSTTGSVAGDAGKQTSSKAAVSQRRSVNSLVALVALIIALVLFLGTLAYVVPSATVTVTLAAKAYSSPVTLIAKPQQAVAPGLVPAEQLTHDFSVQLIAKATGSKAAAGSPTATGTVTFTNNGAKPLDIPTGTVVTTADGKVFTTTVDVAVPQLGYSLGNSIDSSVQGSVNTTAGTVTVIPPDSLNGIVKSTNLIDPTANVTLADVKLQVSNATPISGGGTKQVLAVQQADLDGAKAAARTQEQSAIDAWAKQNTHAGDVAGTPLVTNIAILNAPAVNTEEDSGTFPVTLKLSAVMLLVRNADVQAATAMTLNNALKKDKVYNGSYVVFSDPKQPLTIAQMRVKGDEKSLSLSFKPTAKVFPNISKEQVQHLVVGKSKAEAQSALMALNPPKNTYVQAASVETWPSFINWIPFLTSHINVNLVARP